MKTETGFRLQVMTPAGEWVEVTDPADPILARVGEDFRNRAATRPAVTGARVFCRGCHDAVATADDTALGGLLTDHDRACTWHSMTGCAHDGRCYEEAGTTALLAPARGTELENRSKL